MVFQKINARRLLVAILLISLLFCCPVVPVFASSDVADVKISCHTYVSYYNVSNTTSYGGAVAVPVELYGVIFNIPDTVSGDEYIIHLKVKNLESIIDPLSSTTVYAVNNVPSLSSLTMYFGNTLNLESPKDGMSYVHYLKDGSDISFTVDSRDSFTPICFYTDEISSWAVTYYRPSVQAGQYWSTNVALTTLDFYDISYEKKVGGDELLEETKKQTGIMEEQNETTKGIFGAIKDFFGSFFDNLIDMIVGLVIPSSDDLTNLFSEINEWFGDRLGFIWYPFSLMIDLVSAFALGNPSQYLTVPSLSLNILGSNYVIWNELEVDMDAFGIFQYVRYFTSVILVSGIVKLAVNKWNEWIGGRNSS